MLPMTPTRGRIAFSNWTPQQAWRVLIAWTALAVLSVLLAPPLAAQTQTGTVYGLVVDEAGTALPGVTLTLTGPGAPQIQQSGTDGRFRFVGLDPGSYSLEAQLDGYSPLSQPSVTVSVGRNTNLELRLSSAITERIEVTAESPLLDPRVTNPGVNIPTEELESIPTARDPWAVLTQAPGVLTDRINVGGNESGQQSNFISPGTNDDNSVWAVDGVVVTDMTAIGGSPGYYNFDAFEEMQISTGGSDVSLATGGVTMNLVTRRGTNEWRGSARYILSDEDYQEDLDFDAGELGRGGAWNQGTPQANFAQGNRIVSVEDWGADLGGPLVRDRAWIWGTYGLNDIALLTLDDVSDTTELESYATKLNLQLSRSNSLVGFYHYGNKVKIGRDAGPTRPQPTTFDQDGPTEIFKLEDSHIFGPGLFLTGMVSQVNSSFSLTPQGGGLGDPTFPNVVRGPDSAWRNSFQYFDTDRPQEQAKLDASYYLGAGRFNHELSGGLGYRKVESDTFVNWPGQQLIGLADIVLAPNVFLGVSTTETRAGDEVSYVNAFVKDTITSGRVTASLGLRYDRQEGTNLPATVQPAPIDAGGVLLGGTFGGADAGFSWESITPRLGLTVALGENQETLLRGSFARFADQLSIGTVSTANPANAQSGTFLWLDNGDLALTADEVGPFIAFGGVDPSIPGLRSVSQVDPNLDAPVTDELLLGVEHALLPEFVVGLNLTARRYSDILENELLVIEAGSPPGSLGRPHTRDDYVLANRVQGTLPDGTPFDVPVYSLRSGLSYNGGVLLENGDREQDYLGLSLTFNKRLANRWLLRGHVTWSEWEWSVPEGENEDPTPVLPGNTIDGGAVLIGGVNTSGLKGDVFINSNWAYDVSALYQVAPERRWGFNVATNISGRQGYPLPYNVSFNPQDGIGTRSVLGVADVEDLRADDLHVVNARIEKEVTFGELGVTFSLDGFNLFNEATALQRATSIAGVQQAVGGGSTAIGTTSGDYVRELLSPRIFRLGARLRFR